MMSPLPWDEKERLKIRSVVLRGCLDRRERAWRGSDVRSGERVQQQRKHNV